MIQILLIVHLLIALAMIGVVLLQRSEGGGLGIGGGGGGGMSGFMTGRGTANVLTRTTAILAALFMVSSIALAILTGTRGSEPGSILDQPPPSAAGEAPASQNGAGANGTGANGTGAGAGSEPASPSAPSVPVQ